MNIASMTREEAISAIQSNRPTSGYTMLCEALDMAVAALREQEERMWIPVTERLPDAGKDVIIYSKIDGVCVDYYDGDMFGYWDVTHWMPMPKPPKEGAK